MIVDQSEIDALLREADVLASEVGEPGIAKPAAPRPPPAPTLGPPADRQLARILRIRVPVIVRLAERTMAVAAIRDLSVGAIIEFDKSVEDPLDLLVNNRLIGHGQCVKVGENFGLRITDICDRRQRVLSMGGQEPHQPSPTAGTR